MTIQSVRGPDEWEAVVRDSFYSLAVHQAADGFAAHVNVTELPRGLRIAEINASSSTLRRSPLLVRTAPSDHLLFLMQMSGSALARQGDQELHLHAGAGAFFDPTSPYDIHCQAGHQFVTMVPRQTVLPGRLRAIDVRTREIPIRGAALRVFRLLAEEVSSDAGEQDGPDSLDGISIAASELLRSAASSLVTGHNDQRTWANHTLLHAAKTFIADHLSTPGLSVGMVAAALAVSPRQVSAIFAPEDSPAAFIRRERLIRARRDLADPALRHLTVAAIAARWGFTDQTTFARAFRRAFNQTPTEGRFLAS